LINLIFWLWLFIHGTLVWNCTATLNAVFVVQIKQLQANWKNFWWLVPDSWFEQYYFLFRSFLSFSSTNTTMFDVFALQVCCFVFGMSSHSINNCYQLHLFIISLLFHRTVLPSSQHSTPQLKQTHSTHKPHDKHPQMTINHTSSPPPPLPNQSVSHPIIPNTTDSLIIIATNNESTTAVEVYTLFVTSSSVPPATTHITSNRDCSWYAWLIEEYPSHVSHINPVVVFGNCLFSAIIAYKTHNNTHIGGSVSWFVTCEWTWNIVEKHQQQVRLKYLSL
jgi:hypothetical protein